MVKNTAKLSSVNPFKKLSGRAIEISFRNGGFFGDAVSGIVKSTNGNFVNLDYCEPGEKEQSVNVNDVRSYSILSLDEKMDLINYHKNSED